MPKLPLPPTEPARVSSLAGCMPEFAAAVGKVTAGMRDRGFSVMVFESLRTDERQTWLYGFGREYDDGRGPVTKAPTAVNGWHRYGLACDIVEADNSPWVAPQAFWQSLGELAEANGLTWGGRWKVVDLPHIQWGKCPASPTAQDIALLRAAGPTAVWRKYRPALPSP